MSETAPRVDQDLLPWLTPVFEEVMAAWRGHALLLHGPAGIGQFELGLALARAGLCETPLAQREAGLACMRCAGCLMLAGKSHPDLLVLVPESLRALWDVDPESEDEGGAAKASAEIRVDAVRRAVEFAQQTTSRGGDKMVLIYPAESMNAVAANTLLKTLEEPAGRTRFILASGRVEQLLPTVRSRCQPVRMPLPATSAATAWLHEQGVEQPEIVLAAAGGQPQLALERAGAGWDARSWARWPSALIEGGTGAVPAWPLPWLVEALVKLCHDVACVSAGGTPRFFPASSVPQVGDLYRLTRWSQELLRHARQMHHPLNASLQAQALCLGAKAVLARAKFTISPPTDGAQQLNSKP